MNMKPGATLTDPTGIDVTEQLSRVVSGHTAAKKDFYSATHTSTFKVSGRHVLNIWRICRSEVNLTQYTFENVVFHLLHQRLVLHIISHLYNHGGWTLKGDCDEIRGLGLGV